MANVKLYNLARMTTATTGTGTITLGQAVSGFLTFADAGVSNGETVTYAISDGAHSEIGRGVYTTATLALTRSVLKSTNSNNAINLSGTAQVFITAAKEDFLQLNEVGAVSQAVTFADTTQSTSSSTGAVIVSGGVGIAKNVYAGGTVTIADTTQSTSSSTGAVIVSGGVGIAKNVHLGGTELHFAGGSTTVTVDSGSGNNNLTFKTRQAGFVLFQNDAGGQYFQFAPQSAFSLGNFLQMAGAAAGAGNAPYITVISQNNTDANVNFNMSTRGTSSSFGWYDNGLSTQLATLSRTQYRVIATTASTSTTTGAIRCDGGMGVAGAVYGGDKISSVHATAGVGYSTGAGGTVTQLTDKSTSVTLNKVCGQITLNNATLNADTTVSFTLTNSAIAAGDVLVLNHISGGTAGSYTLNAQSAGGSASINVRNVTAGNLSEAIVIAFAVVKAVTA